MSPSDELIFGRQPVLEALRSGRSIRRLLIARGSRGQAVDEIYQLARQSEIPFDVHDRAALDRASEGAVHQGVVAYCAARNYADFDALLDELDMASALIVFLDGIQDPHNLGAIIRSAWRRSGPGMEEGSNPLSTRRSRISASAAPMGTGAGSSGEGGVSN